MFSQGYCIRVKDRMQENQIKKINSTPACGLDFVSAGGFIGN